MPVLLQSDLENSLQIDVGSEPDTTVAWYIAASQGLAEDYTERHFDYDATKVEVFDGNGRGTILHLDLWPIASVASVVESGVTLTVNQGFIIYDDDGYLLRTSGGGRLARAWRNQRRGITVTYAGGYQVDQTGDGAVLPTGLKTVLTRITARLFHSGAMFAANPVGAGSLQAISLDGIGSQNFGSSVFGAAASPVGPSSSDSPALLGEEMIALDKYANPGIA